MQINKKLKLNPILTPYTKINLKWMVDLRTKMQKIWDKILGQAKISQIREKKHRIKIEDADMLQLTKRVVKCHKKAKTIYRTFLLGRKI